MKFGSVLRELLEESGMSQKELAGQLNIAVSTLGNYIREIREPDYETLKSIAAFFNVSTDYLLDFHKKDKSHNEERIVQLYKKMTDEEQKFFIEQGKLILKYKINTK